MLINPSIAKLNVEDLNQRYRNSIVEYQGDFVYFAGFDDTSVAFIGHDRQRPENFDWRFVNCERVPTGWVTYDKSIAYLCYHDARQYSRGYQEQNNTILYRPWSDYTLDMGVNEPIVAFIHALRDAAARYRNKAVIVKANKLNDKDDYQIVNRRVAITRLVKSPFFRVWYRTTLVGFTDLDSVIMRNPLFRDDLQEFFPQQKMVVDQGEFLSLETVSALNLKKRHAPRPQRRAVFPGDWAQFVEPAAPPPPEIMHDEDDIHPDDMNQEF